MPLARSSSLFCMYVFVDEIYVDMGQRGTDSLGVTGDGVHDVSGGAGELSPLLCQPLHCLHQFRVGL